MTSARGRPRHLPGRRSTVRRLDQQPIACFTASGPRRPVRSVRPPPPSHRSARPPEHAVPAPRALPAMAGVGYLAQLRHGSLRPVPATWLWNQQPRWWKASATTPTIVFRNGALATDADLRRIILPAREPSACPRSEQRHGHGVPVQIRGIIRRTPLCPSPFARRRLDVEQQAGGRRWRGHRRPVVRATQLHPSWTTRSAASWPPSARIVGQPVEHRSPATCWVRPTRCRMPAQHRRRGHRTGATWRRDAPTAAVRPCRAPHSSATPQPTVNRRSRATADLVSGPASGPAHTRAPPSDRKRGR